jgi:hypothetical protein
MSTKMRAKLQVQSVTQYTGLEQLKLSAVCGQSPEDNSFSKATPCATLDISISNPDLHGKFKPGQKFYVDFTPTEN